MTSQLPNLRVADVINIYPNYGWKEMLKAPYRAILHKAIQTYAKLEWGTRCPDSPAVHQGIYLGGGRVFEVTWPVARIVPVEEFIKGKEFKVFRYAFNASQMNMIWVEQLLDAKTAEMVGKKYDWLDLGGFLAHALINIVGWPAAAVKILPIIFGKTWKLAPFNLLGLGNKQMVCSVGVATLFVALHENLEINFPRPFFVETPGELDVESGGDYYRAIEAIDPSCVEIWKDEFTKI
jgi:hypothetical protein